MPSTLATLGTGGAGASTLLNGLISYWKLDEASGAAVDSVGTNTLTDNNTVTSAAGKVGTARQFTAANSESLSIADNASIQTGDIDFTLSLWARLSVVSGVRPLYTKDGGSSLREFTLYVSSSANFTVFNGATTSRGNIASAVLSINTWYHIVADHDSVNNLVHLYVNGVASTPVATSGATGASAAPMRLGTDGLAGTRFADGQMDDVKFWKRILTAGEIAEDYANGLAGRALL